MRGLLNGFMAVFGGRIGLLIIAGMTAVGGGGAWLYFKTKYYNQGVAHVTRRIEGEVARFRVRNAGDRAQIEIEDAGDAAELRIRQAERARAAERARQRLRELGDTPEVTRLINGIR